jgi:hypothetical protein
LFALIDIQAREHTLTSSEQWSTELAKYAFKETNGDARSGDSGTWEKRDSSGLPRAQGFFLSDKISIWLFFFPSVRVPMPDPVIAQLLRDSDSSEIEDNGVVEFGFPQTRLTVHGASGRRTQFIALTGSTLTGRRVVVEWP